MYPRSCDWLRFDTKHGRQYPIVPRLHLSSFKCSSQRRFWYNSRTLLSWASEINRYSWHDKLLAGGCVKIWALFTALQRQYTIKLISMEVCIQHSLMIDFLLLWNTWYRIPCTRYPRISQYLPYEKYILVTRYPPVYHLLVLGNYLLDYSGARRTP